MTTALVVDPAARCYRHALVARFPELRVLAAETLDEVAGHTGELAEVEVLIAHGGPVRAGLAEPLTGLRWAQSLGAGVDAFVDALAGRDVLITSTRGMHATQMAELALTQLLVLSRDVPRLVGNQTSRTWQRWAPSLLAGKSVGIVGMGVCGRAIATLCAAFGMRVLGISRSGTAEPPYERVYRYHELAEAAAIVDFLVLVTALDAHTRGLVGAEILESMKRSAFLVSLSRGGIADEQALHHALTAGTIRGAALDVFSDEPLPPQSPFWSLPNVFLTPHTGGLSQDYVDRALEIIVSNVECYLRGAVGEMLNLVP